MIYHDIKSSGSNESDKYMTFYKFYNVYLVFTIVYIRMIWCKYRNCPSLCPLFGLCIVLICATQKYRYPTSNSKFHLFDKCWYYQTLHYNFLLERFLSCIKQYDTHIIIFLNCQPMIYPIARRTIYFLPCNCRAIAVKNYTWYIWDLVLCSDWTTIIVNVILLHCNKCELNDLSRHFFVLNPKDLIVYDKKLTTC